MRKLFLGNVFILLMQVCKQGLFVESTTDGDHRNSSNEIMHTSSIKPAVIVRLARTRYGGILAINSSTPQVGTVVLVCFSNIFIMLPKVVNSKHFSVAPAYTFANGCSRTQGEYEVSVYINRRQGIFEFRHDDIFESLNCLET